MITMVMYAKIRRMFFREHLSISEIQRRTSLSRNTIKKWLKEPGAEPKYRRNRTDGKLAPFESKLRLALEAGRIKSREEEKRAGKLPPEPPANQKEKAQA